AAPEGGVVVARRAGVVQPEPRPLGIEGALLRRREPPLAQHEAAHAAIAIFDREGFWGCLGAAAGEWIRHAAPPHATAALWERLWPRSTSWPWCRRKPVAAVAAPTGGAVLCISRRGRRAGTRRWRSACAGCGRRGRLRDRPRRQASSRAPSRPVRGRR